MKKLLSADLNELKLVVADTALLAELVIQAEVKHNLVLSDAGKDKLKTAKRKFEQQGKGYLEDLVDQLQQDNPLFSPYVDTAFLICVDHLSGRLTLEDITNSGLFDITCLYYGITIKKKTNTPVRSSSVICTYLSCESLKYISQVTGIQISTLNLWFRNKLPIFFAVARQVGEMRTSHSINGDNNALSSALVSINDAIEQLR